MSHPEVVRRGDDVKYTILGKRLHSYNRFTSELELEAIIPASKDIALRRTPLLFDAQTARDALKIVTDEAYHALCAEEMTHELTEATGVYPGLARTPAFLVELAAADHNPDRKWKSLNLLSFACISETLITGILAKVPQDKAVIPEVRSIIADHARDEAVHHAYFSGLMRMIWLQLSDADKDIFGPMLPHWIVSFLSPDKSTEADWLIGAGFTGEEATRIVNETYEDKDVGQIVKSSARPSLNLMRKIGMFDHPATSDALGIAGL
jgi:hypothetical protein